jgi:uncharacterized protein YecE (DUF72 family)
MNSAKTEIARVGTSGVVIPGSKNSFPDKFRSASRLHYYSSLFNTVEINSTFKKIPKATTVEKWSVDVPVEFQFTIKIGREVTHAKPLTMDIRKISTFMDVANHIQKKKGCILAQFPASIKFHHKEEIERILQQVRQNDQDGQWHLAIEFRDESWYRTETMELLSTVQGSMVLHDMPKSLHLTPDLNAPFAYFRFHGPKGDYRGNYSNEFLSLQSEKINSLLYNGKKVYVYFNNTMGNAFENAMTLKSMIQKGVEFKV